MLNYLIEDFANALPNVDEAETVSSQLSAETLRIMDPYHLLAEVINEPEFAWDFTTLRLGFMDLVGDYCKEPGYSSALFLRGMAVTDPAERQWDRVVPLIEFPYFANNINDVFNLNPLFMEEQPDLRSCEKVTQLRYAAQFLNKYPGYLLYRNILGLSDKIRLEAYRWFAGVQTATGLGRGTLLGWCSGGFNNVQREHYYQCQIYSSALYIQFPLVLAGIFAELPDEELERLKKATGFLTVAAKISMERRSLAGRLNSASVPQTIKSSYQILDFPGFALCHANDYTPLDLNIPVEKRYVVPYSQYIYNYLESQDTEELTQTMAKSERDLIFQATQALKEEDRLASVVIDMADLLKQSASSNEEKA